MNKKMIVFTIGKLLTITGLLMFMPVIVSLILSRNRGGLLCDTWHNNAGFRNSNFKKSSS